MYRNRMQTQNPRNYVVSVLIAMTLTMASPLAANDDNDPCAYFILIDQSVSMNETPKNSAISWQRTKHDEVMRQLADFTTSLPPESRVFLYTFARDLNRGPDVILGSDQERATLQTHFAGLKATGDRTHLWSALNLTMDDAGRFADQNPGRPVRLLVYSDGEDNEQGGPGLTAVLKRHERLLKDHVKLTYITLGFTLRSDLKTAISEFGSVRESLTPVDVLPLIADFSWLPRNPVVGETVQFIDHSSGVVRDRSFDFGDGSAVTTRKAPEHEFTTSGDYKCRLTLTGTDGSLTVEMHTVTIAERPALKPAFRVSADEVQVGERVILINETNGENLTFEWDLGNGKTSTERNPSVLLDTPGNYSFGLKVTNRHGQAAVAQLTTAVRATPLPKPQVEILGPTRVVAGDESLFVAEIRGEHEAVEWHLDDGKPFSSDTTLRHKFAEAGHHALTVVAHSEGGDVIVNREIEVSERPALKPAFRISSREVRVGDSVTLINETIGDGLKFEWKLADEKTSNDQHPVFTVDQPGTYTFELQVTDRFGRQERSRMEDVLQVLPLSSPELEIIGPDRAMACKEALFFARIIGEFDSISWSVDGHPMESTTLVLEHSFAHPGQYQLTAIVHCKAGDVVVTHAVTVTALPLPKPSFVVSSEDVETDDEVVVVDTTTGDIDHVEWDFGDGQVVVRDYGDDATSDARRVVTSFSTAKENHIQLTAFGPGGSATAKKSIRVKRPAVPTARMILADIEETTNSDAGVTVSVGDTLRFVDCSIGMIENRTWTVNTEIVDGAPGGTLDYTFSSVGKYKIGRGVSNSGGESLHTLNVTVEPFAAPKAAVEVGSDQILAGETVVFTDVSEGLVNSIDWDFGDGTKQSITYDSRTAARIAAHCYAKPGIFHLRVTITGPGGIDMVSREVQVRPSHIPPVAVLVPDKAQGREELSVHFLNKSSGSVIRSDFDFGDGTTRTVDANGDVQHAFGPGKHVVTLTAHGPENIAPSKAQVTIEVSAPMSETEFWAWIGGAGSLLVIIAGFVAWPRIRDAREFAESLLVGGVITVKADDPDGELTVVPLHAESREATFAIGPSMHGVLKSVEGEDRSVSYQLDVFQSGELTKSIDIPVAKDVNENGFVIRYVP